MKVINDKTFEIIQFDTRDIKRIFLDGEIMLKVEFKNGVVETIYEGADARDELKRIRKLFNIFLPNFQPRTK